MEQMRTFKEKSLFFSSYLLEHLKMMEAYIIFMALMPMKSLIQEAKAFTKMIGICGMKMLVIKMPVKMLMQI